MGIPYISCKCIKSCKDTPNEVYLTNGENMKSEGSNTKINNNPSHVGHYYKSQIQSILFKSDNLDIKINPELDNLNPKEKINEKIPPVITEDSEENKFLETNNYPIKTVASTNRNYNNKLDSQINSNNDNFEKNEINSNNNLEINNNIDSQILEIKYIPNFDKTYFFTKKLKNAEKNFTKPINYDLDLQKYIKEDDENNDVIILVNSINNNKGANHKREDGVVMEYNGEKYLYIGETDKNHFPTGLGILYTQGKKYEGNFCKGKLLGLGRYIDEEGTCFEGIFENNKIISKATVIKINEDSKKIEYFGDLVDLKKNGKGEEICENSYKYTGDFVNDKWEGEGQLENYDTGDIYNGHFEQGKINGKGIFKWKNGEIYEGNFINGIKHGKGIHRWPDGSEYEGEYNNGIRDGKAKYTWADGRIFKGYFKKGKPEGKGIIIYNGKTVECEYKDGKPTSDISKFFNNS